MTTPDPGQISRRPLRAHALIERFGPHPTAIASIDLAHADDAQLARWLWLAVLLSSRASEDVGLRAFRSLERESPLSPADLAKLDPETIASRLADAELERPEISAQLLQRLATALIERHGGSLAQLAASCDGLAELGQQLTALASGFGAGATSRFLRPLRDLWPGVDELPIDANARAAAVHLGWIDDADEMADGATLRAGLCRDEDMEGSEDHEDSAGGSHQSRAALQLSDVEAALERLGRAACRRANAKRCPLGEACAIASR